MTSSPASARFWQELIRLAEEGDESNSPAYLIDLEKVAENYRLFKSYFPRWPVHFALKSNSDPKILRRLVEIGADFEVASVGDRLELTLKPQ